MLKLSSLFEDDKSKGMERICEFCTRFRKSKVWVETNSTDQIFHEIPFSIDTKKKHSNEIIYWLDRKDQTWFLMDFKADSIFNL